MMRVQVVELTLSDGRTIVALFPAFVESASLPVAIRAVKVFESYEDDSIAQHTVNTPTTVPVGSKS